MAEETKNTDTRNTDTPEPGGNGSKQKQGRTPKTASEKDKSRRAYLMGSGLLIVLSIVCFITAFTFGSYSGAPPTVLKIPVEDLKEGKIVGKIEPTREFASYQVELRHPISSRHQWSQVTGEVLDANQNTLFSFGEELWADFEGNKVSFSANFNFPKKDTYYLKLSVEMPPNVIEPPQLEVTYGQTAGSGVMFIWLGAFAAIGGISLWMVMGGGVGAIRSVLMVSWPFLLVGGIVFLCIYLDIDCTD